MIHPVRGRPLSELNVIRTIRCSSGSAGGTSVNVAATIEAFSLATPHLPEFEAACTSQILGAVRSLRIPSLDNTTVEPTVTWSQEHHARQAMAAAGPGLAGVGSVIAVSSGKGGVGKSTVAVNLAYALAARGARVGILDADIHGPSLPTMVAPADCTVRKQPDGCINALEHGGVKLMSYGWVAPRNARGERTGGAMRGPLVSSVVQQLLKFTSWGQLDHLVVDLPPGTGDVHVTLGQAVPISTAVIVTTPQRLALADVARGLDLFAALKVPAGALVLNMAYFTAPDTGTRYYPFGDARVPSSSTEGAGAAGGDTAPASAPASPLQELMARYGIPPPPHELPMDEGLSAAGDSGTPYVLRHPQSLLARAYAQIAAQAAAAAERQVAVQEEGSLAAAAGGFGSSVAAAAQHAEASPPKHPPPSPRRSTDASDVADESDAASDVARGDEASDVAVGPWHHGTLDAAAAGAARSLAVRLGPGGRELRLRVYRADGALERALPAWLVRQSCRCAACVDEVTGAPHLRAGAVPASVRATRASPQGNYGLALEWSDGHTTGIYTFEQLAAL